MAAYVQMVNIDYPIGGVGVFNGYPIPPMASWDGMS